VQRYNGLTPFYLTGFGGVDYWQKEEAILFPASVDMVHEKYLLMRNAGKVDWTVQRPCMMALAARGLFFLSLSI